VSALPFALAMHLVASCAPTVAPETLLSVVHTESGFDALAIGDNTDRRAYHPASLAEAVALAGQLIAAGHNLDLGIAQLNWRAGHLQRRGLSLSAAFDPCTSLRVGGEVLAECWARSAGPTEQARLRAAIGCYNAGHPVSGTTYVRRVEASAERIVPAIRVAGAAAAPAPALPAPAALPGPPPPPPPSWDVWGQADYLDARAVAQSVPPAQAPAEPQPSPSEAQPAAAPVPDPAAGGDVASSVAMVTATSVRPQ